MASSQAQKAWPISILVALAVAGVIWFTHSLRPALEPISHGSGAPHLQLQPAHGVATERVTLPKHLCPPSEVECYAHYQFAVAPGQLGDEPQSLFFPGSFGALAVRLNGVWLTPGDALQTPIQRLMFSPRLISVSRQAIAARQGDDHQLQVIVGTPPNVYEWLAPFYLGPTEDLAAPWQLANFLAQSILVVSNGIYLILLLLTLLVYRLAGSDPLFLWFGLLVVCALVRNLFFVWVDARLLLPMAVVYHLSTNLLALSSLAFVCTLIGVKHQRRLAWLVASGIPVALVAVSVLIAIPQAGEMYANNVTQLVVAIATLATMVQLFRYFGAPWDQTKSWVLGCFVGSALFVAHDILSISLLKQNVPAQLSSLSPLMVVMAFCFILASRLGVAFSRTRDQNKLLEVAVREREQKLFAAYAQLRTKEQEQTVRQERQRLMRDLHDGVGGQLASLALTARRTAPPELATKIEESLVDLRAVVDYVDDDRQVTLGEFLTDFKARVSGWGELQTLEQRWHSDAWQSQQIVDAQWRLHTSRILQEAIANLIQHALASVVSVRLEILAGELRAEIIDDGIGIKLEDPRATVTLEQTHRGLDNMRSRARALGGRLELQAQAAGGTRVAIYLPLHTDQPQEASN